MRSLAQGHYSHDYIFEKPWLHFFGLPFILQERLPLSNHRIKTVRPHFAS